MSQVITPRKTERDWIVELNLEPGVVTVLYPRDGALETEILPALSAELKEDFERLFEKHRDTFAELKRLGD
jgi:hypothetical protein